MKSNMMHNFSVAPSLDNQRSSFNRSSNLKTTFDAGLLIPIYVDEALPGDTFKMNPQIFGRMTTPLNPVMDNIFLDTHWFAVPMRQLWDNFRKFMGERVNPNDSIDFTMPTITVTPTSGDIFDYFGLPVGQSVTVNSLFFRAYNHIYNEWFRDQNLIDTVTFPTDNTDSSSNYSLLRRGKRHDYFTSCLPFLQKGDAVSVPLGDEAPILGLGFIDNSQYPNRADTVYQSDGSNVDLSTSTPGRAKNAATETFLVLEDPDAQGFPYIRADLAQATASTINQLRQAFQIQKLLERDARSGTRYAEIVQSHFNVSFMDVTYRPEFLGGSSSPVHMHSVPTTTAGVGDISSPQFGSPGMPGELGAYATVGSSGGGFTKSFTEHCIIIGLASVRADLTYQQGVDRMFSRSTRYDYFWPALAHIGEQAVLNKEIYVDGVNDEDVFGYQERYAEYKYKPSKITGKFRSAITDSLDSWHLSQEFTTVPGLNQAFIEETPPLDRVLAYTDEPHFIVDANFQCICARPMPLHSVPGLIDHF
jgi:hypothetical protein